MPNTPLDCLVTGGNFLETLPESIPKLLGSCQAESSKGGCRYKAVAGTR
jgi:hypothetical protein